MQKTDSGLYTARIIGLLSKDIFKYRVSVIDAVEAPVLTVNSNRFSSDSCAVNFTCRAHELMINSSYQNNRCSPKEVTSHENYTLIMDCSEEFIICNHSNPVSWREDRINIAQLCEEIARKPEIIVCGSPLSGLLVFVVVVGLPTVGVIVFADLILYCCCKNKTDSDSEDDRRYMDHRLLKVGLNQVKNTLINWTHQQSSKS